MSSSNLILPINISFSFWCSQLRSNLSGYNIPVAPKDAHNWWRWAEILLTQNDSFSNLIIPSRQTFPKEDDWKKWAMFFIRDVTV